MRRLCICGPALTGVVAKHLQACNRPPGTDLSAHRDWVDAVRWSGDMDRGEQSVTPRQRRTSSLLQQCP